MKKVVFFILVLCLAIAGKAQVNLVINPQFEIYDTCPNNFDGVTHCLYWTSLDSNWRSFDVAHALDGAPEYVNIYPCTGALSYTYGCTAYQHPKGGNGMMQLMMYNTLPLTVTQYQRDYLQGHLKHTLDAGHKYAVAFYTMRTYMSGQAVNGIGAYFDDGTIDSTRHPSFLQNQYNPQIVDSNIISDSANWTKVEGTFTAIGNEHLITIGQFSDSSNTRYFPVTSIICTGSVLGLFFVDDVSVIDCSNIPFAGNDTLIMHVGDSVFLGSHEPLLPYTWYKSGSTAAIDSGGGIWVRPTVTTTYILEQKLCGVKRWDTVKVRVYPDTVVSHVGIEQLLSHNLKVYPNPAKTEFTIEGARSCYVTISDIAGRVIVNAVLTSDKEQMDIASLDRGVYLVEVVDKATGVRVVRKLLKE